MRGDMSEPIRPARAVAPGRIILRELEARGWAQQDLAAVMDRPEQMISEIIHGKKQITAETARQLGKALGTSAEFWLNLEMQYQLQQRNSAEKEAEIELRSRLYQLAPINELIKRAWIQPTRDVKTLEMEYCEFYQVDALEQSPRIAGQLRASLDRGPEDRSILAWARRVEQLAAQQPVAQFSRADFPQFIARLLEFSLLEEDVGKVPPFFLAHGIHFVIVPHLPRTYLDGAALWLGDRPVVALSLRYDRIDSFWFTLLHELAHLYQDHDPIHIDQLYDQDRAVLDDEEIEANRLAKSWLFPQNALERFIQQNRPRYSQAHIEQFAAEQKRHPGLVLGQLMHENEIQYSHLRGYLVRVKPYLADWVDGIGPG